MQLACNLKILPDSELLLDEQVAITARRAMSIYEEAEKETGGDLDINNRHLAVLWFISVMAVEFRFQKSWKRFKISYRLCHNELINKRLAGGVHCSFSV